MPVDGEWAHARLFIESERDARIRAETDPATRLRISYAHEHVERAHGVSGLRRGGPLVVSVAHVRRAGLTLGEASAAGIQVQA